ncbi:MULTISPECIES: protein kinase domain-containing protein [Streptomyces]|uniref:Serine/threonine protein kinase n=1 Tax=Streptomyces diastaticus subsp. diastaticus TaxID=68040 RepID=A0ABQ1CT65_STRDI|nr:MULTISPECIES: serine/threonine-protein kinase [Streptomyces]MBL3803271.1 PQQ-binding-like beta-propeller repeat protein [Streptomyces sp. BRB081]MDQ0292311.1 outer membrane protein assembly factor BamB [Streptomyces sp. DSM 41037]PJM84126.1 serine/threonine protein kinase [Streptomyces sp. TSRI0384-2]GFH68843.1 serine/threonine protein kinase [Streptomyces rutgersensis]GFH73346.1 serine/threonine protein kinase [Streptomyces diastaticus subsp. diastaticus]
MSLRGGDPAEIGGYPLEARLGSGGMGTVFLARTSSGRPVAIKLIHQQFAADEEFRIRFRQEVAAARRVSGAFTAAVVDAAPEAEQPWMATTYIEGETLAQHIAAAGPLDGAELRRLAIGLAEALRDIHRVGVVHRDLKPSNVVLSPEGPRVIDFGISRAADQQTLTMTGRVIGTPPFMSPEQLQAPRGVGPASDVFSLGTLLVYAATGSGPFDADSPYMTAYQVVHEEPSLGAVPEALRVVVGTCLDKEPEGRPSADELLVLLRDLPADLGGRDAAGPGAGRTRDVLTEQHDAMHSTPVPAAVPAGPGAAAGTFAGRRLRDRWRPVLAAAVAVAAIAGGVAALDPGGPDGDEGADKGAGVAAPSGSLPDGFEPWRRTVAGGREDIPDELRCVARGDALFCGGGGVIATRVNARDGSREWTVKSPGVPVQGMHLVGAAEDAVFGYRIADQDVPQDPPVEVVALAADDGRKLWSAATGAQSKAVSGRSQDAVVSGSAVVMVDGANSRLEARDARSGEIVWATPFPEGRRCVPVQEGRRLLAMCASDAELDTTEVRHPALHPLDRASGKLGEPVAVDGPAVFAGEADGKLVLLQEHMEGPAFTGYDGIALVDMAAGKATYSRLDRTYGGTPGMADGVVYVSGQTGLVSALDPATGRRKWSRQTSVEGASGPVAGGGALYFSSATGRVVALAPEDGRALWSTDPRAEGLTGEVEASPRVTLAGRAVVVAADKNTLFAFDAKNPPKSG